VAYGTHDPKGWFDSNVRYFLDILYRIMLEINFVILCKIKIELINCVVCLYIKSDKFFSMFS
jgi:hypothetical protein